MRKIEFDELQQIRRYRYGYQSFLLLAFLVLMDTAASGVGIVWTASPTSTFILLLAACTYFISRCIWGDALVGPKETPSRFTAKTAAVAILSALAAVLVAGFALTKGPHQPSADIGGNELTFVCTVMWVIIAAVYVLKRLVKDRLDH